MSAAPTTASNLATMEDLYAAFGRGDVATILEALADDVRWEEWGDNFGQRAAVPWFEAKTGRDGVVEFFQLVSQFEILDFKVLDLMASGNQVAAEIEMEAKTPGGGRFRDQEIHLWSFDDAGKITRLRHYTDTAKHIAAAGGEDTTAS